VFCTLPGSQSLITCVKFLRDSLFVAANDTGKIFLWKKDITQAGKDCFTPMVEIDEIIPF